tara:strand:- start:134 stop:2683 length:2550 start_codon:yes stop_codon:yes gene_type:complete
MSIIKVNPFDLEAITIQASPTRVYKSGSYGITGAVNLFAAGSPFDKDVLPIRSLQDRAFDDADNLPAVFDTLYEASREALSTGGSYSGQAQAYLDTVGGRENTLEVGSAVFPSPTGGTYIAGIQETRKNSINVDVIRFEPSLSYTADTNRKLTIINSLYPRRRIKYSSANFAYTNYHCLNFFTASSVPRSAALIYPNSGSVTSTTNVTGSYIIDDGFTFEFFVKPKNFLKNKEDEYHAGSVIHLSSSYAISIHSGSSRDADQTADKFRVVLQLSHSADFAPDKLALTDANIVSAGVYPKDLIFVSDDNVLNENCWHHVSIRWGNNQDGNVGAIFVDNVKKGTFNLPSSSIACVIPENTGNPDALIIGNYFIGSNRADSRPSRFFTNQVHQRDGVLDLDPNSSADSPAGYSLNSPLCAEIHDVRIFNKYRTDTEILNGSKKGLLRNEEGLIFYLPPFFTRKSPRRKQVGEIGGILATPFQGIPGSTIDPFNLNLSFGVGGHYLNLENFTQDFASLNFPRLFDLSGSQINVTTEALSANDFLYRSGSSIYRNVFMLPCDNGNFKPNFFAISQVETGSVPTGVIKSGSYYYKYRNDLDYLDLSLINLRNLLPSSSFVEYIVDYSPVDRDGNTSGEQVVNVGAGFEDQIMGASPEDMGIDTGEVLTVFQRTRDSSSNEVVFFDVSNLFYGQRIKPGTLKLTDPSLTGTNQVMGMTLRDDGDGNVYRADSSTRHATWNSVGNIFYEEGIIAIKSPNIPFFGKDEFEISFRGEKEVHVMKADIVAETGQVNSSSNPNYSVVSSSNAANEEQTQFVAISGINFHDDNLNVIMRTKFAQPVIKRSSDKILFRTKLDF